MEEVPNFVCYDDATLIHVASIPYRNFRVPIFRKVVENEADRFYYEPFVALDPLSVTINRYDAKRFEVQFSVELWNACLESQVVEYLRDQDHDVDILNANVHVMPYEEVRLAKMNCDAYHTAMFQVPGQYQSYLQLNETLDFDVVCDSKETAELVGDAMYLSKHLGLDFKSPANQPNSNVYHYCGSLHGVNRAVRIKLNSIRESDRDKEDKLQLAKRSTLEKE